MPLKCIDDRFDNGDSYETVEEFLNMCRKVHGDSPLLNMDPVTMEWIDADPDAETDRVVLVPYGHDFKKRALEMLSDFSDGRLYKQAPDAPAGKMGLTKKGVRLAHVAGLTIKRDRSHDRDYVVVIGVP